MLFHDQQAGHCEQDVKDFVNAKGCLRVAAYHSLDATIKPVEPLLDCCSYCTKICKCGGTNSNADVLPFEATIQGNDDSASDLTYVKQRNVTQDDCNTLKEALYEVLADIRSEGLSLDQSSSHDFSTELIEDIVKNGQNIFTVQDLMTNFPVFSISNTLRVLEVVQEEFMDIPNFEETLAMYNFHFTLQRKSSVTKWFDFNCLELGNDSDSDHELLEL